MQESITALSKVQTSFKKVHKGRPSFVLNSIFLLKSGWKDVSYGFKDIILKVFETHLIYHNSVTVLDFVLHIGLKRELNME